MTKRSKKPTIVIKPKKSKAKKKTQVTLLGQALRSLGGLGGGAVGSMLGAPATGSQVGHSLGAAISKWLGAGDYSVATNSIVAKASSSIPMMHNSGQKIVVRHKEFLCEVRSAQVYEIQQSFTLNPGLRATFPWLSQIASSFQEYKFKGVVFHYIPTSGAAVSSTNAALGSVMLQTTYRSTEAPPSTKAELLNEYWACETVPSDQLAHPIECDPKENPFQVQYVRARPPPAGDSPLIYDLGTTHLAVSGCQSSGNPIGDLWVTYEVELSKPMVASNVTEQPTYFAEFSGTSPAIGALFGTGTATQSLPISYSGNTLTIPRGYYGTFKIWIVVVSNAAISGFNMAGNPAVVNCTVGILIDASPGLQRLEITGISDTAGTALAYACEVIKSDRETVATVTLPAYSLASGVLTTAFAQIWNPVYI